MEIHLNGEVLQTSLVEVYVSMNNEWFESADITDEGVDYWEGPISQTGTRAIYSKQGYELALKSGSIQPDETVVIGRIRLEDLIVSANASYNESWHDFWVHFDTVDGKFNTPSNDIKNEPNPKQKLKLR